MPKLETQIMNEARRVARLQTRIRHLRRDLKAAQSELRLARRQFNALARAKHDPFEQTPPLRMFGEIVDVKPASGQ